MPELFNAFVIYLYVCILFNCIFAFLYFFLFLVLKLKLFVVCGFETRPDCLPFCDSVEPRNFFFFSLEAFVVCSVAPRKNQI